MKDVFLTELYFELFQLRNKEKVLMDNNTFTDDEKGKMDNVRNDQSISEVRQFDKVLCKIIDRYLELRER